MWQRPGNSNLLKKMKSRTSTVGECVLISECHDLVNPGFKNVYIDVKYSQISKNNINSIEFIDFVIKGRTLLNDAVKERFDKTGKCDVQIVDYGLMYIINCVALQKNSPYTSTITKGYWYSSKFSFIQSLTFYWWFPNYRLYELRENGIFDFWDSWYRPMPRQCAANLKGKAEKEFGNHGLRRLSLKNLTGAFIVLSVGIGLSLVAFIYEYFSVIIRNIRE